MQIFAAGDAVDDLSPSAGSNSPRMHLEWGENTRAGPATSLLVVASRVCRRACRGALRG